VLTVRKRAGELASRARRMGIPLDADDLTQITILRFFEKQLDSHVDTSKGSVTSMLLGVLRLVFLEAIRAAKRNGAERLTDTVAIDAPGPLDHAIRHEQLQVVHDGWLLLTDRERTGLARVYGPIFGCWFVGAPTPSDRVAASRAARKLRKWGRQQDSSDE
jgi:DNA-directed RNA polymerase specialized sigma24 family protein